MGSVMAGPIGYVALGVAVLSAMAIYILVDRSCRYLLYLGLDSAAPQLADWVFRRGAKLIDLRQAIVNLCRWPAGTLCLRLMGCLPFPIPILYRHIFIQGSTGSGKSVLIKLLVKETLRYLDFLLQKAISNGVETGKRLPTVSLIAFDPAGDIFSAVSMYCRNYAKLIWFNPFSPFSAIWDVRIDFDRPSKALNLVNYIIKLSRSVGDPFWPQAARQVLHDITVSFILRGGQWTLRDVFEACVSLKRAKAVLGTNPHGAASLALLNGSKRTAEGIIATIKANLSPLKFLAAAQDDPEGLRVHFSMVDLTSPYTVFLFGWDEKRSAALVITYNLLLHAFRDQVLRRPMDRNRQDLLMVVLDELYHLGPDASDLVVSLASLSRKYGVCLVTAVTSIRLLDSGWNNKELSRTFAGSCRTRFWFRCECPEGAKFAADCMGKAEVTDLDETTGTSFSQTTGGKDGSTQTVGTTHSMARKKTMRAIVLEDEVANQKEPTPDWPYLSVYLQSWGIGGTTFIEGATFVQELADWNETLVESEVAMDQELLRPWTIADLHRVNMSEILKVLKPNRKPPTDDDRPRLN